MVFTLFIAALSPGKNAISMIGNVTGLGMSFLCGVFVPQSLLSDTVLSIGKFLPAYWYIKANDMLAGFSTEVFSMNKYWTYVGIECGFSVALFCLTLLVFKLKVRSK